MASPPISPPPPPFAAAARFWAKLGFISFGGPAGQIAILHREVVERLTRNARVEGSLGAITAAVVGVIATLALLLAQVVLFPDGWRAAPDWNAVLMALAAWYLLERARWPLDAASATARTVTPAVTSAHEVPAHDGARHRHRRLAQVLLRRARAARAAPH